MIKRKFGWKRDLPDHRDFKLPLMVRKLPPLVDLRINDTPIVDQGNLGSCTGNAIQGNYDYEHRAEGFGDFTASRLFIYYNERVMEGTVNEDSGAMIRDGFKSIGNGSEGKGVCSENIWPYITRKFARKPCKKCYREALKDQAIQYMSIQQTPAQLKGCLADGHPFTFGFTVYTNFDSLGADFILKPPQPYESVEGGHAVMCVGYDDVKKVYIIRNSWGADWGDKGYFYMSYDYMHNPDLCDDFWCIRRVE